MANQWLRLWHDMPTDPKWKTIARVSGQQISLVQAVYLHLLVDASRNVTRGHATVTHEDLASALDVTEEAIKAICDAMQGRVMDGDYLSGWDKRQVKREDSAEAESLAKSAAQRKREQRERLRESQAVTQSHAASRNVTLDKEEIREEKESTTVDSRTSKFIPPTVAQVAEYCQARGNTVNPQTFVDHYTGNGWMRGKTKIKDWQACVRTWETNQNANNQRTTGGSRSDRNTQNHRDYIAQLEREAEAETSGRLANLAEPALGH